MTRLSLTNTLSTPFGDEHGQPLRLRGGIGAGLWLPIFGFLFALIILSAFLTPLSATWRVVLVCLALLVVIHRMTSCHRHWRRARLVIRPDGTCRFWDGGEVTWHGSVVAPSWRSLWLIVLFVHLPFGRVMVPILRTRQIPGQFRRLACLLKTRTWFYRELD
ncbi:MAG: hypothetical protein AAGH19_10560 [Pseudomonadota bacterium]